MKIFSENYFVKSKKSVFLRPETLRGKAVVARRAHNPEVAGSSPAPATKKRGAITRLYLFYFVESVP